MARASNTARSNGVVPELFLGLNHRHCAPEGVFRIMAESKRKDEALVYLWLYEATYKGTLTRGGMLLPCPCSLNKLVECLAHWRSAAMEDRIAALRPEFLQTVRKLPEFGVKQREERAVRESERLGLIGRLTRPKRRPGPQCAPIEPRNPSQAATAASWPRRRGC
jgi:hypothetical protein